MQYMLSICTLVDGSAAERRNIRIARSALPMCRAKSPLQRLRATTGLDADRDHYPVDGQACVGLISSAQFWWIMASLSLLVLVLNVQKARRRPEFSKGRRRGRAQKGGPQIRSGYQTRRTRWVAAAVVCHRKVTSRIEVMLKTARPRLRATSALHGPETGALHLTFPASSHRVPLCFLYRHLQQPSGQRRSVRRRDPLSHGASGRPGNRIAK